MSQMQDISEVQLVAIDIRVVALVVLGLVAVGFTIVRFLRR